MIEMSWLTAAAQASERLVYYRKRAIVTSEFACVSLQANRTPQLGHFPIDNRWLSYHTEFPFFIYGDNPHLWVACLQHYCCMTPPATYSGTASE